MHNRAFVKSSKENKNALEVNFEKAFILRWIGEIIFIQSDSNDEMIDVAYGKSRITFGRASVVFHKMTS